MELNEVSQLKEATGVRAANEAIEDGWTLLGFLESTKHGSVTYAPSRSLRLRQVSRTRSAAGGPISHKRRYKHCSVTTPLAVPRVEHALGC